MRRVNKTMLQSAVRIAKSAKASAILYNLDTLDRLPTDELSTKAAKGIKIIPVTQRSPSELNKLYAEQHKSTLSDIIHLPPVNMTRMSHIKIAVVHAIANGLITIGERIVFTTGLQGTQDMDSLVILDTGHETELITARGAELLSESVKQDVFQTVLNLSLELAHRGREGKPVGTIFVLGDEKRVMQLSKQMVINPFKGYTEEESNVLNPDLKETIREFSAIDGAFIISAEGRLLSSGRYLNAASDEESVPRGLGSRHIAAGGITALTNAVAIVIAESSGDVRIFKDGKILMEIEKSPLPKAT